MVIGFTKSKEGLAEYAKIDYPYNTDLQDDLYEDWIRKTNPSPTGLIPSAAKSTKS